MNSVVSTNRNTQIELADDPVAVQKDAYQKLKQAEALRLKGKLADAEKIGLSLTRQFPKYHGALHTVGLVLADKGDHEQAAHYLVQAAMINPRSWNTLTALAGVYLTLGSAEMASRTLRDALLIAPEESTIYSTLAEIYYEQREYVLAVEACQKALVLQPDMTDTLLTMARACVALGHHAEAGRALGRAMRAQVPTLKVLIHLSFLPGPLIRYDLIDELEKLEQKDRAFQRPDQLAAEFIRATALDKKQHYPQAWQCAVKGNALALAEIEEEFPRAINSVETRVDWLKKHQREYRGKRNIDRSYPKSVFILGLSRSGKTTAESVLASQAPIYRGYENPAISRAISYGYHTGGLLAFNSMAQMPYQLYSKVKDRYKEIVLEMAGDKKIFTNTTPGHVWDSPIFSKAIPNTKFVFIKRNFFDLALRIFMKNYRSGHAYSYDLKGIRRYATAYNCMIDLMVEALPQDSIIINYEDMVANPGQALDQMCELCGITADHSLLSEIADDTGCSEPYRELIEAALAES